MSESSPFTRASFTAADDSSMAMTRRHRSASSRANTPTPAYASTSTSVGLSRSCSPTSSTIASAVGVFTWKNDGDATRNRCPSIASV